VREAIQLADQALVRSVGPLQPAFA
jgi:hypothetical protein